MKSWDGVAPSMKDGQTEDNVLKQIARVLLTGVVVGATFDAARCCQTMSRLLFMCLPCVSA